MFQWSVVFVVAVFPQEKGFVSQQTCSTEITPAQQKSIFSSLILCNWLSLPHPLEFNIHITAAAEAILKCLYSSTSTRPYKYDFLFFFFFPSSVIHAEGVWCTCSLLKGCHEAVTFIWNKWWKAHVFIKDYVNSQIRSDQIGSFSNHYLNLYCIRTGQCGWQQNISSDKAVLLSYESLQTHRSLK